MNSNMNVNHWSRGFDDPEFGSQQAFRAIVRALDNPGQFIQVKSRLSAPEGLNPAAAAIILTIGSDETTIWADFHWDFQLVDWFHFHCGCSIVTAPSLANLALITKPGAMPPLDHFLISEDEYNDRSSTLIIQIDAQSENAELGSIRYGAEKEKARCLEETAIDFRYQLNQIFNHDPLGVDILLTCDNIMISLPNTIC